MACRRGESYSGVGNEVFMDEVPIQCMALKTEEVVAHYNFLFMSRYNIIVVSDTINQGRDSPIYTIVRSCDPANLDSV